MNFTSRYKRISALFVIIADNSFLIPPITSSLILGVLNFIIAGKTYVKRFLHIQKYITPVLLFFSYVFIVDIIRGGDFFTHLSYAGVPLLLIGVFLNYRDKPVVVNYLMTLFILLNMFFQIMQFVGIKVSAISFISTFGFLEDMELNIEDRARGFRLSGLANNTIGLSCFAGLCLFYFYMLYNQTKNKFHLIITVCCLIVIILTNTRSVIYFAIPILFLSEFLIKKTIPLKALFISLVFAVAFFYIQDLSGISAEDSVVMGRTGFDYSVVDRVQANILGSYGVLQLSPFFGISQDNQLEAIRYGYSQLGFFYGDVFLDHVTYHCLPLFYFRVYGIVGLSLFIWSYMSLFKYAWSRTDEHQKQLLISGLIFFLVYNLSHNLKLNSPYFWIFLSANYSNLHKQNHKKKLYG